MSLNFKSPIRRATINDVLLHDTAREYSGTFGLKSARDLQVYLRFITYGTWVRLDVEANVKPLVGRSDMSNGFRFTLANALGQFPVQPDQTVEYELMYYRDTKPSQLYSSGEGQNLNISALTTQMDRMVMHAQESDDVFADYQGRVKTIDTFEIPSAMQRAHKILTFNNDGTKVEMFGKDLLNQITINKGNIEALTPRVTVNETNIANNVTNITSNTNEITGLKTRVTTTEAFGPRITTNESNIGGLTQVQTGLQSLVNTAVTKSNANELKANVNEAHANANSQQIGQLTSSVSANTNHLQANDSQIQSNINSITGNFNRFTANKARLNAVETKNTFQEVQLNAHSQKLTAHDAKFVEIEGNVKDGVLKVHSAGGNVFDKSDNVSGKFAPLNSGGPYAFQLLKPVLDTKISKISARIKSDSTAAGVVSVWIRAGNVPGSGTSNAYIVEVDVTVNHSGIAVIEFPLATPVTLTMGNEYYLEFWHKSGAVKNLMYDDQPSETAFSSGWLYEQENAGNPWDTKNTWSIKLDSNDTVQDAILGYDGTHLLINNSPVATTGSIATDVARLDAKDAAQDVLITANTDKNAAQDTRLTAIEAKNTAQDAADNDILTAIGANDARITANTNKNTAQDALIAANTAKNVEQDAAIDNARATNGSSINLLTTNVATNTAKNAEQDTRLTAIEANSVPFIAWPAATPVVSVTKTVKYVLDVTDGYPTGGICKFDITNMPDSAEIILFTKFKVNSIQYKDINGVFQNVQMPQSIDNTTIKLIKVNGELEFGSYSYREPTYINYPLPVGNFIQVTATTKFNYSGPGAALFDITNLKVSDKIYIKNDDSLNVIAYKIGTVITTFSDFTIDKGAVIVLVRTASGLVVESTVPTRLNQSTTQIYASGPKAIVTNEYVELNLGKFEKKSISQRNSLTNVPSGKSYFISTLSKVQSNVNSYWIGSGDIRAFNEDQSALEFGRAYSIAGASGLTDPFVHTEKSTGTPECVCTQTGANGASYLGVVSTSGVVFALVNEAVTAGEYATPIALNIPNGGKFTGDAVRLPASMGKFLANGAAGSLVRMLMF